MEVKPGYKQTEVGVIPEEWEVKTLNSLSTISRLAGAEYTSLWEETPNGEIIALRGFNIGQGQIIERDLVSISNRLSLKLKRSRLCKGDVVYPCVGSIGNAVVITDDAKYHIQQNIARITPDPAAIDSDYLANYLMSSLAEREVDRFTSSSSQPSVLVGSLRQYRVPLPSALHEQRAIATALSDVDGLLGGLDRLIAKKRDLKQAAMQQLLTGQTRLPGFGSISTSWQHSTFGEFPSDWRLQPLSQVSAFITKGSTPTTYGFEWVSSGVLFLRSECVSERGLDLSQSMFVSPKAHQLLRRSEVRSGDILMTITGNVGRVVHLGREFQASNINQHIARIRITDDQVASAFVFHFLSQPLVRKYYNQITTGQAYPQISLTQVRNTVLPMPSLPEQTAIATVLSEMDGELRVLEQRREKTRALKQAMMQELLTGRTRLV